MERTTISIPEELLHRLRLIAAEQQTSLAAVVREALEEKVAGHRPRPPVRLHPGVLVAFIEDVIAGAYLIEDLQPADYVRVRQVCDRYEDADVGFIDAAFLAVVERLNEPKPPRSINGISAPCGPGTWMPCVSSPETRSDGPIDGQGACARRRSINRRDRYGSRFART